MSSAIINQETDARSFLEKEEQKASKVFAKASSRLLFNHNILVLQKEERRARKANLVNTERRSRFELMVEGRVGKLWADHCTFVEHEMYHKFFKKKMRLLCADLQERDEVRARQLILDQELPQFTKMSEDFAIQTQEKMFQEAVDSIVEQEATEREKEFLDKEECLYAAALSVFAKAAEQILYKAFEEDAKIVIADEAQQRREMLLECDEIDKTHLYIDFPDLAQVQKECEEGRDREEFWHFCREELSRIQHTGMAFDETERRNLNLVYEGKDREAMRFQFIAQKDEIVTRESAVAIQRIFRGHLGREKATARKEALHQQHLLSLEAKKRAAASVCTSHLRAMQSNIKVGREIRLLASHVMASVFHCYEERHGLAKQYHSCRLNAVKTIQNVGRGFQEREELFEDLDEKQTIEKKRLWIHNNAALTIQFAWRRRAAKLETERRRVKAQEEKKRNDAASKIQSLAKMRKQRKEFRVLIAERRHEQLLMMQRVIRGGFARNSLAQNHSVTIINAFVRAKLSLVKLFILQNDYPVKVIQRAWRSHHSKRRVDRLRAARKAFQAMRRKHNAAVLIQSIFKGYSQRNREEVERKQRAEARRLYLSEHMPSHVPLLARAARGYLGRKVAFDHYLALHRSIAKIQAPLRSLLSYQVFQQRQDVEVHRLQGVLRLKRLALIQTFARSKTSADVSTQLFADFGAHLMALSKSSAVIQRIGRGFLVRSQEVATAQREAFVAARMIQCAFRCRVARRTAEAIDRERMEHYAHLARRRSSVKLQSWWRKTHKKRTIAAFAIQLAYLRIKRKLAGKRELREAIARTYSLKFRHLERDEYLARKEILSDATHEWNEALKELPYDIRVPPHKRINVTLPDGFAKQEAQLRLHLQVQAIQGWKQMIVDEMQERVETQNEVAVAQFTADSDRCLASEMCGRTRIDVERLNLLRSTRLGFRQGVNRIYTKYLAACEDEEQCARNTILAELDKFHQEAVDNADVLLEMCDTFLITDYETDLKDDKATDEEKEEEAQLDVDVSQLSEQELKELKFSRFVQNLRAFSKPDESKREDVTPEELEAIINKNAPPINMIEARKKKRASMLLLAGVAPPRTHAKKNLLPPLTNGNDDSIAAPPSDRGQLVAVSSSSASSSPALEETRIEVARSGRLSVVFGISPSPTSGGRDIAANIPDDSWVEEIVDKINDSDIVTSLHLENCNFTSWGIVQLMNFASLRKLPIGAIDLTNNTEVDDVAALNIAHVMDILPTLVSVELAGTAVSVPKRQLLKHLEMEKRAKAEEQRKKKKHGLVGLSTSGLEDDETKQKQPYYYKKPSAVAHKRLLLPPRQSTFSTPKPDPMHPLQRQSSGCRLEPLPPKTDDGKKSKLISRK